MSLTFHWFLPTNGDSRHVVGGHGTPVAATGGDRPPGIGHLTQIARAAEAAPEQKPASGPGPRPEPEAPSAAAPTDR
ncbi:hypothetical protein ALMP_26380 [Streptomyces sp. A012304]|nr:hypothetical protein ALMP_26380 [Streptomyces sp. A012304]